MTAIKICGLRRFEDALEAAQLGAEYLGFVLYDKSPRAIAPSELANMLQSLRAAGVRSKAIGVFVNPTLDSLAEVLRIAPLDGIQMHGYESPEFCSAVRSRFGDKFLIKALPTPATALGLEAFAAVDALLFDTRVTGGLAGGSGRLNDLAQCARLKTELSKPLFLAGGLSPENVTDAIRTVAPFAIDVSSRLESEPGKKDPLKIRALFENIRKVCA